MVPNKDYYADKDGKLTEDPSAYAAQVAVKGVFLEERIAKRYGITDSLVSVDEPAAVRKVVGKAEPEFEEKEVEPETDSKEESKASVKIEKSEASKPVVKTGAKKK